jgi:hypothetical protein
MRSNNQGASGPTSRRRETRANNLREREVNASAYGSQNKRVALDRLDSSALWRAMVAAV